MQYPEPTTGYGLQMTNTAIFKREMHLFLEFAQSKVDLLKIGAGLM